MSFEEWTDEDRFDICRPKTGPRAEQVRLSEAEFQAELDVLWGKQGMWTTLLSDIANQRFAAGVQPTLPDWCTDEASIRLSRNRPTHPSQPGWSPDC